MLNGARSLFSIQRSQIKGRTFEIPGYGGFLLTQTADFLQEYYQPGKEVEIFENETELVEKVRYYLHHHEERDRIRLEGHHRTVAEHTYDARFRQIFRTLGIR
jgi:spore maturation protein CgeB